MPRGAWSHKCLITQVYGHTSVWSHNCLVTQVFGHTSIWSHTCLVTQVFGHTRDWSHNCFVMQVFDHQIFLLLEKRSSLFYCKSTLIYWQVFLVFQCLKTKLSSCFHFLSNIHAWPNTIELITYLGSKLVHFSL